MKEGSRLTESGLIDINRTSTETQAPFLLLPCQSLHGGFIFPDGPKTVAVAPGVPSPTWDWELLGGRDLMLTMSLHLPACPGGSGPWAVLMLPCPPTGSAVAPSCGCPQGPGVLARKVGTECCAVCRAGFVGGRCHWWWPRLVVGAVAASPDRCGGGSAAPGPPGSGLPDTGGRVGTVCVQHVAWGALASGGTTQRTSPGTASAPRTSEVWGSRVPTSPHPLPALLDLVRDEGSSSRPRKSTSHLTAAEAWSLPEPLHPQDAEAGRSVSSADCSG